MSAARVAGSLAVTLNGPAMRAAPTHVPVRRGAWLAAAALVCGLIGAGSAAAFGVSVRADDYRDGRGAIGFYYLPAGGSAPLAAVVVVPFTLLQYLLGDQVRTRGEETANGVVIERRCCIWSMGACRSRCRPRDQTANESSSSATAKRRATGSWTASA